MAEAGIVITQKVNALVNVEIESQVKENLNVYQSLVPQVLEPKVARKPLLEQ